MEPHYFGGYFLIKTKPFNFGSIQNKILHTCSSCINTSAFDVSWCLSWTQDLDEEEKTALGITDERIAEIHKWTDQKFNEGTIQWGNAMPDLETATTFKNLFYADRKDISIYSIYLSKTDAESLLSDFENEKTFQGQFGLRQSLQKKIEEKDNSTEELLGYDFIGVEDNGDFHSFYCHDTGNKLIDRFSLSLNQYGLFDNIINFDLVRKYLNDETTGLEPVQWYIAKTKRLKNSGN